MTTRKTPSKAEQQSDNPSLASSAALPWGATGIVVLGTETLRPSCREQIELVLNTRAVELLDRDSFYGALDCAIACFHAGRQIRQDSSPAAVRENLSKAINAAIKFNDSLNELDGNSKQILDVIRKGGVHALYDGLKEIISDLSKARQIAENYPKNGKGIEDNDRLHLAVAVADAFENHTNKAATTTKEGDYCSLLAMVLGDALDREVKAPHELAGVALKYRKERK